MNRRIIGKKKKDGGRTKRENQRQSETEGLQIINHDFIKLNVEGDRHEDIFNILMNCFKSL